MPRDEYTEILIEIRNTLNKLFECFEDKYLEIQAQKRKMKEESFRSMLSDQRKRIFPLLFDKKNLSQIEIGEIAKADQSTVSKFISQLIKNEIIEQQDKDGTVVYIDKYAFKSIVDE